MKAASFYFDERLQDLLPKNWGATGGTYRFEGPQSVKHLIEALGIPHTEIEAIAANGNASSLGYLVQDGDRVEVVGVQADPKSQEPRFVVDGHLGRLNSSLRMLGFDCLYNTEHSDDGLASLSVGEDRILLTRDRRLLMRKTVQQGCLVRSLEPPAQLRQVVFRFDLRKWTRPFRRCIRCNGLLKSVDKMQILDRLEPLTRLYFDDFRICPSCRQIYWKGSHFARMQRLIAGLEEPERGHDNA